MTTMQKKKKEKNFWIKVERQKQKLNEITEEEHNNNVKQIKNFEIHQNEQI